MINTNGSRLLGQHISQGFDAELEGLRSKVLEVGGLVEVQLAAALKSLSTVDGELARRVIVDDYKVNALEVEIDEQCSQILARRQPVASDLRLIITVIKTITDLERMGDEAVRVARMAKHLSKSDPPEVKHSELRNLGQLVTSMVHNALDAFARTDLDLAMQVKVDDRRVDQEYETITRELITFMMENPRLIPRVLDVQWSARALERIGDRACNICEYVIYLVKGKDVRHTSRLSRTETDD